MRQHQRRAQQQSNAEVSRRRHRREHRDDDEHFEDREAGPAVATEEEGEDRAGAERSGERDQP